MNLSHLATLAYNEFLVREGIRKAVYAAIERAEINPVMVTIKGQWIIENQLEDYLVCLFPERFKGGIDQDKFYTFNPQEAEYAGLITES